MKSYRKGAAAAIVLSAALAVVSFSASGEETGTSSAVSGTAGQSVSESDPVSGDLSALSGGTESGAESAAEEAVADPRFSGYELTETGTFSVTDGNEPFSLARGGSLDGPMVYLADDGTYTLAASDGSASAVTSFTAAQTLADGCYAVSAAAADGTLTYRIVGSDGSVYADGISEILNLNESAPRFWAVTVSGTGIRVFDAQSRKYVDNIILSRANDRITQVNDTFYVWHSDASAEIYDFYGNLVSGSASTYRPVGSYYLFPTKNARRAIYNSALEEIFVLSSKPQHMVIGSNGSGLLVFTETTSSYTLYGLLNEAGDRVIGPVYNNLVPLKNGSFRTSLYDENGDLYYGVVSSGGGVIGDSKYTSIDATASGEYVIGKCASEDGSGTTEYAVFDSASQLYIIPCEEMNDTLIACRKNADGSADYYVAASGSYALHTDNQKSYAVGPNLLAQYDSAAGAWGLTDLWSGKQLLAASSDQIFAAYNMIYARSGDTFTVYSVKKAGE